MEANLSYRILNHEISFGKSDHWFAPTVGGAFMYSNNAENIYAFQIDRTEPLYIPLLSRLTGPFRYDFFVGSLKGHTDPNDPWMHVEKINFKPTPNVEFGFERSVIWGGKGRACLTSSNVLVTCDEPITLQTFLKSFFSTTECDRGRRSFRAGSGSAVRFLRLQLAAAMAQSLADSVFGFYGSRRRQSRSMLRVMRACDPGSICREFREFRGSI